MTAVGLVFAWQARGLGLGAPTRPGPGFFPFWLALGLVLVSLVSIPAATRRPPSAAPGLPTALVTAAAVAAAGLLLEHLGLAVATFLFLAFVWGVVDRQPPAKTLLISAIATGATYLLFDVVLRVRFPRGVLGF